jgi:hypothetical protein
MNNDDKIKSEDYINDLFAKEGEMLASLEGCISLEAKNFILNKISDQKKILLGIVDKEAKAQEKIDNRPKPAIDDNYFDKKPLNLNNI